MTLAKNVKLSTMDEISATLFGSTTPAQTDILRGYLVARRRALLLESSHIEKALAELDRLRIPKGADVDC